MGYRTMLNTFINDIQFTSTFYPLLLQRAIEGINEIYDEDDKNFNINIMSDCVEVGFYIISEQIYFISDFDNIDKAKRAALEWIFERMDK